MGLTDRHADDAGPQTSHVRTLGFVDDGRGFARSAASHPYPTCRTIKLSHHKVVIRCVKLCGVELVAGESSQLQAA